MIVFSILLFFSLVFVGILVYTTRFFSFNGNPIAQIMFHVLVQIDGADPSFIKGILLYCVITPLIVTIVITFVLYNKKIVNKLKTNKVYLFIKKIVSY